MKIYDNETLKVKIKRKKTVGKVICLCLWILIAFVFVCICIAFAQRVIAKKKYVNLFGCSSFAVMSGSMQPDINVYDIIVVKKVAKSKLSTGDIIAFFDGDGNIVTHRIAEISKTDGDIFYTTKGDANNANDAEPIPYKNVIGKYSFKIPGGVHVFAAITSPWGIAVIIILLVFIGFLIIRRNNRKAARHSIREKYKKQNAEKKKITTEQQ